MQSIKGWLVIGACVGVLAATAANRVAGQEGHDESRFLELRQSSNRATQLTVDRYFGLIRRQEWKDATGRFTTNAKYVSHDPEMKWVKLSAVSGSGSARTEREITVQIDKLSRVCQSRVRQIAFLQNRLSELADAEATTSAEGGAGSEDGRGGDGFGEDGRTPLVAGDEGTDGDGREAYQGEPTGTPQGAEGLGADEGADVGAADGTGLGNVLGGLMRGLFGRETPASGPEPELGEQQEPGPLEPWQTSYQAFHAQITPRREDPSKIDFGQLHELRTIAEYWEFSLEHGGDPARRTEMMQRGVEAAEASRRLGMVTWEATLRGIQDEESGTWIDLDLPPLPEPLTIRFAPSDPEGRSTLDAWRRVSPGDRVRFRAMLDLVGPTRLLVRASEPQPAGAGPPAPQAAQPVTAPPAAEAPPAETASQQDPALPPRYPD